MKVRILLILVIPVLIGETVYKSFRAAWKDWSFTHRLKWNFKCWKQYWDCAGEKK